MARSSGLFFVHELHIALPEALPGFPYRGKLINKHEPAEGNSAAIARARR
jgi:hypothetical protein